MRVFFGFRRAQLHQARRRNHLAQRVLRDFQREDHRQVKGFVVFGHAEIAGKRNGGGKGKAREVLLGKGACQFPRPVCPEVEEQHRVAGAHNAVRIDNHRFDEFVGLSGLVGGPDAVGGGCRVCAFTQGQRVVGPLHTLPAFVAIHGVKTAAHRGDAPAAEFFHEVFQLFDIGYAAGRRRVAPVHEGMHENLAAAALFDRPDQRFQMFDMRVDAAVGEKPHQMQAPAACAQIVKHSAKDRIAGKRSGGHRVVDAA